MRQKALLVCVAGAIWLLSFGFAQPKEDPVKGKAEKAKSDESKAKPRVKTELKAEKKKTAPEKAAAKMPSKTPVADLLRAAVDRLLGNEAAPAAERVPAKVAVVAARQVQAVAMAQQMEQQYAARFRQMYRSELHLMRLVCQPTRQQYEKISAAGEAELKASIKKYSLMFAERQQGGFRPDARQPDPRKLIADGIATKVKAHLSSEQTARYEKELDQREAARRRVVLLNLLAAMDKRLILTAEQRDKLGEILDKNWHDSWSQTQLLMQGGQYFPVMPDAKILPVLTQTQKSVWQKVQKGNVFWGSDLDMFQGIDVEEEVWSEPGEKK